MALHILIADPDEYLTEMYREYLERRGNRVTIVRDGLACIEALRQARPDVLVLDPTLLWGGGDGVLAIMHADSSVPSIPVIISAYALDRGLLYRLAPFCVDDFHIKPLSCRRLTERIQAVVKAQQIEVAHETIRR